MQTLWCTFAEDEKTTITGILGGPSDADTWPHQDAVGIDDARYAAWYEAQAEWVKKLFPVPHAAA